MSAPDDNHQPFRPEYSPGLRALQQEGLAFEKQPRPEAWDRLQAQLAGRSSRRQLKRPTAVYRIALAAAVVTAIWFGFWPATSPTRLTMAPLPPGEEAYYRDYLAAATHLSGYARIGEGPGISAQGNPED